MFKPIMLQIIKIDHSKFLQNSFRLGNNVKSDQMQVEVMFCYYVNHTFIELLLCIVGGKENIVLPPHRNREERKDSQCWTL